MAKKVRTPPPPRKVQAPKVRTDGSRKKPPAGRAAPTRSLKDRLNLPLVGAAVAIVVAGVLIGVFTTRGSSGPKQVKLGVPVTNMKALPGILLTKPPWPANNGTKLKTRLETLGIPELGQEQLAFHIHQHLDIYVDGKHFPLPALVGISTKERFFADLHTHDTSGVIHVESAQQYDYTLGQFFGVWGVRLSKGCIGGLCATASKPLKFYVQGKPFVGDPTRIVLQSHEEIAVVYGAPPSKIPSHYSFPAGE